MSSREFISRKQRVRWLAFAFVPSSLMLGVTSYLATDIASIPLLWIMPLSIYLLSFVLVFARRQIFPVSWLRWLLSASALGVVFQILSRGTHPVWLVILIHLVFLFLAAMTCHGRLAMDRPPAAHLLHPQRSGTVPSHAESRCMVATYHCAKHSIASPPRRTSVFHILPRSCRFRAPR